MWEYELIDETSENNLIKKLNEYGAQNWEGFGFTIAPGAMRGHYYVLMKRQK